MIMPYNHDDLLTTDRSTPIFKLWDSARTRFHAAQASMICTLMAP